MIGSRVAATADFKATLASAVVIVGSTISAVNLNEFSSDKFFLISLIAGSI